MQPLLEVPWITLQGITWLSHCTYNRIIVLHKYADYTKLGLYSFGFGLVLIKPDLLALYPWVDNLHKIKGDILDLTSS